MKCSEYVRYDYDERAYPCHCPICGAFLKWEGETPICNKCGTELIVISERDEETQKELGWGKICPISLPKRKSSK